jgi:hypothetical protein
VKPKRSRAEVTVELDQYVTIQRRRGAVFDWCTECKEEVVMVTPDEAASLTSASTRSLYRLVDGGKIHFSEAPTGLIRLCLPSLLAAIRPQI